ncbi:MAG: ABC transporter permease [SAR116 cluster bacterium]|nr:ABC transporter permease [SAR116 cluster bacterium]
MTIILKNLGKFTILSLKNIGRFVIFGAKFFFWLPRKPFFLKQFFKQIFEIGYLSLPVVGLTAFFSGMVLAIQSYTGFARLGAEDAVATVVVLSVTRELGPVLAGLMVAGRVGASITAEIGTMKVSEQIDALYVMSTRPIQYLVIPRVLAGLICLPFLVLIGDIIGIMGGWIIGVYQLGFNSMVYMDRTIEYLEIIDIFQGLVKATIFGFIITLMGCYQGFHCGQGAKGVGRATTNSVVTSSILILISNYFITTTFFGN